MCVSNVNVFRAIFANNMILSYILQVQTGEMEDRDAYTRLRLATIDK